MQSPAPHTRPETLSRIPCLDGIRAVAIGAVILLHTTQRYNWPAPGSALHRYLLGGSLDTFWPDGVGIFFVLSGFLITTLLLREYDRSGDISLKKFYVRRCFRILPPFYTYIGFILVFFLLIHPIPIQWTSFTMSALFLRDYAPGPSFWATGHTWSLGVEEQFYLIWPVLLLLGLRSGGRRRGANIAIGAIVLAPILRVGGYLAHISFFAHREGEMFHCRMDGLMCGCLIAILAGTPRFEAFFARASKFWWLFLLYVLVLDHALTMGFGIHYQLSLGLTANAIAIALLMFWLVRNPDSWLGRFLNTRIMVKAGVLSYSAYLWQTFFIHVDNTSVLSRMPYALIWIWVAAWLSYRIVERPALRMRDRVLERKKAAPAILAA
jgi:peptidoglycan/LPS O-acetylase OafA/YrhL